MEVQKRGALRGLGYFRLRSDGRGTAPSATRRLRLQTPVTPRERCFFVTQIRLHGMVRTQLS